MKKIEVFTRSYCGDCQNLKKYLNENNISFIDSDLENNKIKEDELYELTGSRIVPTFVVRDKGLIRVKTEYYVGYEQNKGKIEKIVNKIVDKRKRIK